ncbi:hypothetical protein GPECTOR_5g24 [Gonium pectorale]|uniref:Uncharacterized protein n=1 Tax=Gonium pectorale TaxID=33097 RepID=A0A150GXP5_GONPE|nr:hypothetical protein GPECTOR_5g24 [Gonium pectorale]|eukprot:KXZ54140.1 hypothetical protein GPECTOR_5g24 [Gonium pectorale]
MPAWHESGLEDMPGLVPERFSDDLSESDNFSDHLPVLHAIGYDGYVTDGDGAGDDDPSASEDGYEEVEEEEEEEEQGYGEDFGEEDGASEGGLEHGGGYGGGNNGGGEDEDGDESRGDDGDVPPLLRSLLSIPSQASQPHSGQPQPLPAAAAPQGAAALQRERHSAGPVLEGAAAAATAATGPAAGQAEVGRQRNASAPTRVPLPPMPSGSGAAPPAADGAADAAAPAGAGGGAGRVPARRNAVAYPRSQLLAMLQELRSANPGGAASNASSGSGADADATNWIGRRQAGAALEAGRRVGFDAPRPGAYEADAASALPPAVRVEPTPAVAALLRDAAYVRGLLSALPGVQPEPPAACVGGVVRWLSGMEDRHALMPELD